MKFFAFVLALPLLALASPVAEPEPEVEVHIEKRTVTCALTGSDVRYHVSPNSDSKAPGQFGAKGTKVPFKCFSIGVGSGSCVGDDCDWNKVASGKGAGYYVSDYYVSRACANAIQTLC